MNFLNVNTYFRKGNIKIIWRTFSYFTNINIFRQNWVMLSKHSPCSFRKSIEFHMAKMNFLLFCLLVFIIFKMRICLKIIRKICFPIETFYGFYQNLIFSSNFFSTFFFFQIWFWIQNFFFAVCMCVLSFFLLKYKIFILDILDILRLILLKYLRVKVADLN